MLLQNPRLTIGSVKDGYVFIGQIVPVFCSMMVSATRLPSSVSVIDLMILILGPSSLVGPDFFLNLFGVVRNYIIGSIDYKGSWPVILFKLKSLYVFKVMFILQDVFDGCPEKNKYSERHLLQCRCFSDFLLTSSAVWEFHTADNWYPGTHLPLCIEIAVGTYPHAIGFWYNSLNICNNKSSKSIARLFGIWLHIFINLINQGRRFMRSMAMRSSFAA